MVLFPYVSVPQTIVRGSAIILGLSKYDFVIPREFQIFHEISLQFLFGNWQYSNNFRVLRLLVSSYLKLHLVVLCLCSRRVAQEPPHR
jgi:hypothetical protein